MFVAGSARQAATQEALPPGPEASQAGRTIQFAHRDHAQPVLLAPYRYSSYGFDASQPYQPLPSSSPPHCLYRLTNVRMYVLDAWPQALNSGKVIPTVHP
jgi:hypothetical protein